jgi:hypothetical protein
MATQRRITRRKARSFYVRTYASVPVAVNVVFDPSLRQARDLIAEQIRGNVL